MASTGHKGSINDSGCVGHALCDHSGMQVHLVASTGHKGSINSSGCVGHALSLITVGYKSTWWHQQVIRAVLTAVAVLDMLSL